MNSLLQKLSTWVTARSNICTKIDLLLLIGATFLRAIRTYEDKIKELIGAVFSINETCNKETCDFANVHRYNPTPIYVCKKCKAWTLVQKIPFSEQE